MHEYLAYIIDVVGDGHYRFHVVSSLLGKCVDDHHIVHLELTIELNKKRARYLDLFGSKKNSIKLSTF
jgi:hypothetical protein